MRAENWQHPFKLRVGLSTLLVSVIAASVLIGIIGTAVFLTSTFRSHAEEDAKRALAASADTVLAKTEALFGPSRGLIDHIRAQPISLFAGKGDGAGPEHFEQFFRAVDVIPASNAQIAAVYVGYPDGVFVLSNRNTAALRKLADLPRDTESDFIRFTRTQQSGVPMDAWSWRNTEGWQTVSRPAMEFDPRTRPWYVSAANSSQPIWTPVYKSVGDDRLTITLASRLGSRSEEARAVAAVDLRLDDLVKFIKELRIGKDGFAFLAGPGGALLAHPNLDLSKLKDRTSPGPTLLDSARDDRADVNVFDAFSRIGNGRSAHVETERGTLVASKLALDPALGLEFDLYVAAPLTDFTAASDSALQKAILVVALFMCIVVLTGILIARSIATRMRAAVASIQKIAELNDSDPPALKSSRLFEIETLNQSIRVLYSALDSFRRYVPADIVRRLTELRQPLELGGERREITVLFTDIQGFTRLSETIEQETLAADLADYFDLICGIIARHGGTVDKFIGDSVMAFWGAPADDPDQSANAVRAVREMISAVEAFNADRKTKGRASLRTRFALHRGYAFVGNIGSRERFGYTAIGDVVNTAAHLEGAAGELDVTALATAPVVRAAGQSLEFRQRREMQLRGKSRPIEVFEFGPEKAKPSAHLSIVS